MIVILAGSSGLIGSSLEKNFRTLGYDVIRLFREDANGEKWDERSLTNIHSLRDKGKCVALINCAYDFSDKSIADTNINYLFARRLIDLAKCEKINYVYNISSLSAYEGCASNYGKVKLMIEGLFLDHGYANVRMGLIRSKHRRTLLDIFGTFREFVPFHLILKDVTGYQYISNLEAFCEDFERILASKRGTFSYADSARYSITELIRPNFCILKIAISIDILITAARIFEYFFTVRFGSDSLLGLKFSFPLELER